LRFDRGRLPSQVGCSCSLDTPAIGPCCYEAGENVAAAFRARFGGDVVRDGRLDLCTACDPDRFFSYRRDGKPRGGHGVLARVA
jgi:copper oxidase (laccase) domain-containing protein